VVALRHHRQRHRTHEAVELGGTRTELIFSFHLDVSFCQCAGSYPSISWVYSSPAFAQPSTPSSRVTLSMSVIFRSARRSANQPAARRPRPREDPKQSHRSGSSRTDEGAVVAGKGVVLQQTTIKWQKSPLPQYQITLAIPAFSQRSHSVGRLWYRLCAGKFNDPRIVPPCKGDSQTQW
jgi:hypothetical protein